jgi:PAS domain S-box-containing protein
VAIARVPPRGLFASGKFDQHKRDIPYATLAQAFQGLIRQILAKNEEELGGWRDALREALGPNGQLMVELVPELKLIIGEQQLAQELPSQDARHRFQLVFRRFVSAFTRVHPLALFVDDLQWLDAATLDLIEDLMTHPDVNNLMLIGAYRDNEVTSAHPLTRKLQSMREAGAIVHDIVLAPLTRDSLRELITDTLHCERGHAGPLAGLVEEKTAGNPFFAIQFFSALADESLLTFDYNERRWCWDLNRIRAKGYTDNVADILVGKLNRLPTETQEALQQLGCLGNSTNFAMIPLVYQEPTDEIHRQLWEAVRTGLIFRSEDSYRFLHDRVQEAAYYLVSEKSRAEAHLRIGTLMASRTPPDKLEEGIFDIANQLNRGSHLITSIAERERVAEFNLVAGRRAKASTAYVSALSYLFAGRGLLTDETWTRNYDLVFSIEHLLAECELLTADMAAAENRLSMLAERAKTTHHVAIVTHSRLTLYTALGRSDRAVEVFIEFEKCRGKDWSPHPTREEVLREYDKIWFLVGPRQIEELVDLPFNTDPDALDVLDVFIEVVTPALFTDQNLLDLLICRMVNLGLEYGNCDGSCFAYVWLGSLAGPHFRNYQAGFRFGKLGYDLVEKHGWHRYQARIYLAVGHLITPWTKHVMTGRELMRRSFDVANRGGDLTYAAYGCTDLITSRLTTGDPLAEVQREAEIGLEFASKIPFGIVVAVITVALALIRTLRGSTTKFGSFSDDHFDELQFERHLSTDPTLALPECWYWIRKLQALFFGGDYPAAIKASLNAKRLLWTSPYFFEVAEYHFFSALSLAGTFHSATDDSRGDQIAALADHHRQLEMWAENCPENFENRSALVGAEIARIEGRYLDAERLYEVAIESARTNGFVQNEALAYEVAARFYGARNFETFADAYLRKARDCYLRWGADGKVQQLDRRYPHLIVSEGQHATAIIGSPVQHLDVASVVKASQAVSSEIELPKLIERLMTIAIENAGAERSLLILPSGDEYRIEAEAQAIGDQIEVTMRQEPITQITCPESLVRYVIRTQESVILDDASKPNLFSANDYLRHRQSKSILCMPLIKQRELAGVLLLENTLTTQAFTPSRIAVLELLAAQAAISLDNTRLYSDLQEREAKIRRLVDANIIGIYIIELGGQIVEANDAFLRMLGYEREDLVSGHLHWPDLTPPEWHAEDRLRLEKVKTTGRLEPFEKEYFRKDGSRVPVLVGVARFEETGTQAVAFVIDLTERKRAEQEHERLRQLESDLAHVNRLSVMGELAASLAHEILHPIATARNNARTGMRFLEMSPPNLDETREALGCVVRDVDRAKDIVGRMRDHIKKAPPGRELFDLNGAVTEVTVMVRNAIAKNGITVSTHLMDGLAPILGDRVQLQQVIMNLILNAVEAMSLDDKGVREISIRTEQSQAGGDVLVEVRDSGPGIDQANLERVFEPFYTTKTSGIGMGLSICRSIVDAHGGRLWVSANEPRGAAFQFTLPAAQ